MQFTFCPLFSGSSGNCIYVAGGDTRLLIDAGMSGKAIAEALQQINVLPETLSAILVTHEHIDHTKGVGVLSRRFHLPVYATEPTMNAMAGQIGPIPAKDLRIFDKEGDFYIGNLAIRPFAIPHDAADPVGYRIDCGCCSAAVATDMGCMKKSVLQVLRGANVLLLESNHDPDMVMINPHYTAQLKRRILSNHGHLSNENSARALLELYGTGVRHVLLGHLSAENNTPELAYATASNILSQEGVIPGRDLQLSIAWRDKVSQRYDLMLPET